MSVHLSSPVPSSRSVHLSSPVPSSMSVHLSRPVPSSMSVHLSRPVPSSRSVHLSSPVPSSRSVPSSRPQDLSMPKNKTKLVPDVEYMNIRLKNYDEYKKLFEISREKLCITNNNRINNILYTYIIKNFELYEKIGSDSVNGEIYKTRLLNNENNSPIDLPMIAKVMDISDDNKNELEINKYLSKFVSSNKSKHFLLFYGSLYCEDHNKNIKVPKIVSETSKYLISFQEKVDGDLKMLFKNYDTFSQTFIDGNNINRPLLYNIILQSIFSILTLNCIGYTHHDSHLGNFLYSKNNKYENRYYHYKIFKKNYYLQECEYNIIINDFGLSRMTNTYMGIFVDIIKYLFYVLKYLESHKIQNKLLVDDYNFFERLNYNIIKQYDNLQNKIYLNNTFENYQKMVDFIFQTIIDIINSFSDKQIFTQFQNDGMKILNSSEPYTITDANFSLVDKNIINNITSNLLLHNDKQCFNNSNYINIINIKNIDKKIQFRALIKKIDDIKLGDVSNLYSKLFVMYKENNNDIYIYQTYNFVLISKKITYDPFDKELMIIQNHKLEVSRNTSDYVLQHKSKHFLLQFYVFNCELGKKSYYVIVSENIEGILDQYLKQENTIELDILLNLYLQTLICIGTFHDLNYACNFTSDNIFSYFGYQKIDVNDNEYFHYIINNKNCYIKNCGYNVVLFHFDTAVNLSSRLMIIYMKSYINKDFQNFYTATKIDYPRKKMDLYDKLFAIANLDNYKNINTTMKIITDKKTNGMIILNKKPYVVQNKDRSMFSRVFGFP